MTALQIQKEEKKGFQKEKDNLLPQTSFAIQWKVNLTVTDFLSLFIST